MKIDVNFQGVYTNIHFCPALEITQANLERGEKKQLMLSESTSNQKK